MHKLISTFQGFIRQLLNYTEYNQQWNVSWHLIVPKLRAIKSRIVQSLMYISHPSAIHDLYADSTTY